MALPASVILKVSLCSCSQGFLQLRGGLSLLHGQRVCIAFTASHVPVRTDPGTPEEFCLCTPDGVSWLDSPCQPLAAFLDSQGCSPGSVKHACVMVGCPLACPGLSAHVLDWSNLYLHRIASEAEIMLWGEKASRTSETHAQPWGLPTTAEDLG